MVVEQQWRQPLSHVPFQIAGEHAEQHGRPDSGRGPVDHGAELQVAVFSDRKARSTLARLL